MRNSKVIPGDIYEGRPGMLHLFRGDKNKIKIIDSFKGSTF